MSKLTDIEQSIEKFIAAEIAKIGDWIAPQMDAAAKLYAELSDFEKESSHYAYGVIAIINAKVDDIEAILPSIQKTFPDLKPDILHGFLDIVLNDIQVVDGAVPLTLDEAITTVASYLKSLNGNTWAQMSQAIGNVFLTLLSPETPIQKAMAIGQYVYVGIIQPLIKAL